MKKIILAASVLCIMLMTNSCQKKGTYVLDTDEPVVLNDKIDSLSWALGFSVAQNVASTGVDINREVLLQAICVTLDSKQQAMTQTQTYDLLQQIEQIAYLNRSKNHQKQIDETRAKESVYFDRLMKDNPNVKKSDKGFYYEVIKEGDGRKGEPGLVVVFDYKGSFLNGQVFDQTYGNREPIVHVISESIFPGLFEGFCMMRAGSTYRFYFPSEMAFGANGTENVPPYTAVIYDVELHEVRDL
ncbi:MAG: FKBP-type peptidyl-prolyl cis-trans isomerase [Bacteroidales bacterium]|nr:FKBP-type peptidyl-prolyl cis-trans isomerase [Bacteroidales bacterium]